MKCNISGAEQLTVGKIFEVLCQAEQTSEFAELDLNTLELRLEQADQFKLQILEAKKPTDDQLILSVTSYRTGQHQLPALQIVDQNKSYVLGDLQFTVASVMDPAEPRTEPYPTLGPLGISIPLIYWLVLAAVFLVIVTKIYFKLRKSKQKKKLLLELNLDSYAQSPSLQFYTSLRKARRLISLQQSQDQDSESLNKSYKEMLQTSSDAYLLYLSRTFHVPAVKWSHRQILNDLKENHKLEFKDLGQGIKKTLVEIHRALKNQKVVSEKEVEQLMTLLSKQVDIIENKRGRK